MRVWLVLGMLALSQTAAAPRPVLLETVRDVPLPGPATRFDYQTVDTTADRLYISHMGAGELVVFDLRGGHVVGVVRDLPRVTGVCAIPELGKVYASVPGRKQVAVIDARSSQVVARVGRIGFPDGIAFAPKQEKVYVSDESDGGELVIDGRTNRVVTTIPIGGDAGNTIFDPGSGHILVAVQTRQEFVEIDPESDRVVARHPVEGSVHPHGMALDPVRRLLFVADEEKATLFTVDLETMTVAGRDRVGEEPDVLGFDVAWGRLYVASESGVVSMFAVRSRRLSHEGDITMPHAHSVSVDPRTHRVYFPLQSVRGRPVLRIMNAARP